MSPDMKRVVQQVRVEAPPERVFALITEPDGLASWMAKSAEVDLTPGGALRVRLNDDAVFAGEYLAIEPYSRVVFTFGWEGSEDLPPGASRVEIVLTSDGDATLVELRHDELELTASRVEQHDEGWTYFLGELAKQT
jgi:uncharacterized protein YndB with AHSA1/START domain